MSKLERIVFIDRTVRERGKVTLSEVARHFEVTIRQVRRDLEYLRDRLDAPLAWDPSRRGYVYETPWRDLEFADEKALLFFVFARAAAGTLAYVPLAETGPLERLRELVPPTLRGLERAVRYELPDFEPADGEALALLLAAIGESCAVDAAYRNLDGQESERRIVPRRLVNYAGTWYCIAWDQTHRALRVFKLSRFMRMARSGSTIDLGPDDSAVDAFLDSSYGMFKGSAGQRACVRFRGKACKIVQGELWHPEQAFREGADALGPWYELEVPVSYWEEILGRVLRFGAEAEPVSPPEFRRRWLEAVDLMAGAASRIRAAGGKST